MDRIRFKCENGLLHVYEVCHWRTVEVMKHNRRLTIKEAQQKLCDDLEAVSGSQPSERALFVIDGGKK